MERPTQSEIPGRSSAAAPAPELLANLYLDGFDEAVEDARFRLVRYADDFVILARSLADAQRARDLARDQLAQLGLALNEEETAVRSIDHQLER